MNYFSGCRHRAGSRFRWLSFVRGFGRLLLAVIAAQGTEEVRGKRQKTYIGAAPARMLKRSALMSAGHAPSASPKLIARGVGSPPDDGHGAGDWRRVSALLAIEPQPRCGVLQVTKRGGGTRGLHGRDWTLTSAPSPAAKSCRRRRSYPIMDSASTPRSRAYVGGYKA